MDSTSKAAAGLAIHYGGSDEMICFRCGRPASMRFKLEALVDHRRLKVAEDARDNGICSPCMIELAEWVKAGQAAGDGAYRAVWLGR